MLLASLGTELLGRKVTGPLYLESLVITIVFPVILATLELCPLGLRNATSVPFHLGSTDHCGWQYKYYLETS